MKKQTVNSSKKSITRRQAPAAWLATCLLSLGLTWALPTLAAEVTCANAGNINADTQVNCFKPNTPAKSAEVNANFERLLQHIATLQQSNTNLQQSNTALQQDVSNLQQSNTALLQKKLLIEGVNVQIVNGAGTTDTTNGTGNLIIGYNKDVDPSRMAICSMGDYTTQADCENNGGTWATNQRQGSHNVVIGNEHQYTQYGGFVTGIGNVINGTWASVSGGYENTASGEAASVSGGGGNTASGEAASVSGGEVNIASGWAASISGGRDNTASGEAASVSGGHKNTASELRASVSGGAWNKASANYASVSGGSSNNASGEKASVSGGYKNTASKLRSSVSGGSENKADGEYSSILGGQNIEISTDYQTYPNP